MNGNRVCTRVIYSTETHSINFTNFTKDPAERAFGIKKENDTISLDDFFRDRCFPETRFDCKRILKALELDFFDAELIVRKTHGVLFEDTFCVKFDGEDLNWYDVKLGNR